MPRVGFEPTIPVFERAKIFHALDRAATMIGKLRLWRSLNHTSKEQHYALNMKITMKEMAKGAEILQGWVW
jgi:hypothetical protein